MDIDPTTVTLALTSGLSMLGNAAQAWRSRAKRQETEATTTAAAYTDARDDLEDCRKRTDAQAAQIEELKSSNVVLMHGLANLQRDCAERDLTAAIEREADRKRLEALRDEFTRWKAEVTR